MWVEVKWGGARDDDRTLAVCQSILVSAETERERWRRHMKRKVQVTCGAARLLITAS